MMQGHRGAAGLVLAALRLGMAAGALGLATLAGASTAGRADARSAERPSVAMVTLPATGAPVAPVSNFRCHILPPQGVPAAPPPPCDVARTGATGAVGPHQFSVSNLGGPVITQTQHRFIFLNCTNPPTSCFSDWGNPLQFTIDYFASSFIHVLDQYIGEDVSGKYSTSNRSLQITGTQPHVLHDSDVHNFIREAIVELDPNGGGGGYNQMYSFFLPNGQDLCHDAPANASCYCPDANCGGGMFSFCAYHGSFDTLDALGVKIHVIYQAIPFQDVAGCRTIGGPNGTLIDSTDSVLSRELTGALTDPDLNAWFDFNSGNEITDNCSALRQNPITLNTRQYDIQPVWSNNFANQTGDSGADGMGVACVGYLPLVTTHDFDFNQASDILWRDTGGTTVAWLMNKQAIASTGGLGVIPLNWSVVGQRDFNGDGKADLLWRDSSTGTVAFWFMNGTSVSSTAMIAVSTSWNVVGTADFDGDGHGDILWRDTSGNVAIWLMNGGTVNSAVGLGPVATNWIVAGTGDFNQDGHADILWRDTSSGTTVIWFMNGTSVASTANLGIVASNWTVIGTGDFNGDQRTDILWRDTSSGTVALWLMNGASIVSAGSLGVVPSNWSVADTGDFNFDFKSDLLWRDSNTGAVAMWFMNGLVVASSATVGTVSPSVWTILGSNAD